MYKLVDYDEEATQGTFYQSELQRLSKRDVFKVDKILKCRKRMHACLVSITRVQSGLSVSLRDTFFLKVRLLCYGPLTLTAKKIVYTPQKTHAQESHRNLSLDMLAKVTHWTQGHTDEIFRSILSLSPKKLRTCLN